MAAVFRAGDYRVGFEELFYDLVFRLVALNAIAALILVGVAVWAHRSFAAGPAAR